MLLKRSTYKYGGDDGFLNYRRQAVINRVNTMDHADGRYLEALRDSEIETVRAAMVEATKDLK